MTPLRDVEPGSLRLGYQRQDSVQTLAEGLEEYYRANLGRETRPSELSAESAPLFRNHDMCHAIVGLKTTPEVFLGRRLADVREVFEIRVVQRPMSPDQRPLATLLLAMAG
jgi:hypothetical protein